MGATVSFEWNTNNLRIREGVVYKSPCFKSDESTVWYLEMNCTAQNFLVDLRLKDPKASFEVISVKYDIRTYYCQNVIGSFFRRSYGNGYFEAYPLETLKIPHIEKYSELKEIYCSLQVEKNPSSYETHNISSALKSNLAKDFLMLVHNKKYTDVTFLVEGKTFQAHRLILSARSDYFDTMFNSQFTEGKTNQIPITTTDAKTFEAVLIYIYTDKVPNFEYKAEKLFKAADEYLLKHLKRACGVQLVKNMNLINVLRYLELADLFYEPELKKQCLRFIKFNHTELVKRDGWKLLKENNPRLMTEILEVFTGEAKV